jgi:dienelactone hydrolase
VALLAWEMGPEKTRVEDRRAAETVFRQNSGLPVTPEGKAAFEILYQAPVLATRDAKPSVGRYPVLICAPGQGYPAFDNSVLAEYLASHGFIVLASPSMGPEGRDMPDNLAAMDTGSRDLEYLLGYAQSLPQADPDRIAAMGFSLGGSSAALFTLRNARVKALISLDGVLRDDRYLTQLQAFPQFLPEGLRAALLWIACGPASSLPGFGEGSFQEQAKYAERVKAVFPGLLHHDFSSMSSLQRRRAQSPAKDWSSATASYEAACRLILGFLDSHLKGVAQKLDQEPAALCKVTFRPAKKAPPTVMDFHETALREGLPKASELVQILKKEHPNLLPSFEDPMVLMGYEALGTGSVQFALQLFALTVEIFPDSIDGSYGLGKAHMAEGAFNQAEPHFGAARSKVERDPKIAVDQKAGILARIDKILDDIRAKKAVKR